MRLNAISAWHEGLSENLCIFQDVFFNALRYRQFRTKEKHQLSNSLDIDLSIFNLQYNYR